MRLGMIFGWLTFIVGGFFGVMLAAYWVGALAEERWFTGASHLTAILFVMLVCVMVPATLFTMAERKWGGFFQNRTGPNRARLPIPGFKNAVLGGLPHIIADVVKMLTKEAFRPAAANSFLFKLAPILAFAPVFALSAIVPAGPSVAVGGKTVHMVVGTPDFGLLYIFAIASLAVYGTSLAGWSSNNKFALLGGVRASSQMISYEVGLGLSLVGLMIAFSTVQLGGDGGMTAQQGAYLWKFDLGGLDVGVPAWGFVLQPVGFLIFFAAAFAETKRAPFDAPEGESEIVGYFLEYSGMQFGMFMISEFIEVVILGTVLVAVFFGGYHLGIGDEALASWGATRPILYGAICGTVFWLKVIFLCYVQLAVRWSFPRFRYDQIQTLGWKILLPAGLLNVFVSGALILWDPTLRWLALFGFAELAVLVFLVVTQPRQVREQELAAEHAAVDHGHGGGHDDQPHGHGSGPGAGPGGAAVPAGTH